MAHVTLDDYLEQVRELIELAEDAELVLPPHHVGRMKMLRLGLQRMEAQLGAGESSRAKLRAHKARKNRLSTGAQVPLWGDE
jgi:hypothetical protein